MQTKRKTEKVVSISHARTKMPANKIQINYQKIINFSQLTSFGKNAEMLATFVIKCY